MFNQFSIDECVFLTDITQKISKVLQLESKILENAKVDTQFSPGTPTINYYKLEKFVNISRQLFSYISSLSESLHKVARNISSSYTRVNSFHQNAHTQVRDLDTFSYTLPLELLTTSHVLRLQNDFINGR